MKFYQNWIINEDFTILWVGGKIIEKKSKCGSHSHPTKIIKYSIIIGF